MDEISSYILMLGIYLHLKPHGVYFTFDYIKNILT
jgi:hypothetical protein